MGKSNISTVPFSIAFCMFTRGYWCTPWFQGHHPTKYPSRRSYKSRDRCSWCCWMPQRRRKRPTGGQLSSAWVLGAQPVNFSCFFWLMFCDAFLFSLVFFGLGFLDQFFFFRSFFWALCLSIIFISVRNRWNQLKIFFGGISSVPNGIGRPHFQIKLGLTSHIIPSMKWSHFPQNYTRWAPPVVVVLSNSNIDQ